MGPGDEAPQSSTIGAPVQRGGHPVPIASRLLFIESNMYEMIFEIPRYCLGVLKKDIAWAIFVDFIEPSTHEMIFLMFLAIFGNLKIYLNIFITTSTFDMRGGLIYY